MDDRLYRSRTDRMIAGVAGGLADRWDIDPSLVRVGWVFLMLITGGIFFLLYLVMAIVVPEEPLDEGTGWPSGPMAPPPAAGGAGAEGTSAGAAGASTPDGTAGAASAAVAAAPGATDPTTGQPLVAGPPSAGAAAPSAREARRAARRERRDTNAPLVFGGILVVIGVIAFAGQVFPAFDWSLIWPIALVILGGVLVVAATRRDKSS